MVPSFKPVLTFNIFWHRTHDGGFGVTKLCVIPSRKHYTKKPPDSAVQPVNSYLSKIGKKGHHSKSIFSYHGSF